MIRRHFQHRETIATILADAPDPVEQAIDGILEARTEVEDAISRDSFFATTFSPCTSSVSGKTVSRMVDAGFSAGVGPMAAVAGAIAWAGVESLQHHGARFGVVDNGGDIALRSDRGLRVGIFAGGESTREHLAFELPPQEQILGICTSSATIGHSVSLGMADAVTVLGTDPARADAWATAICNRIRPDDRSILDRIEDPAIQGVLAILGEEVIRWGSLPPLKSARLRADLITRGRSYPPSSRYRRPAR